MRIERVRQDDPAYRAASAAFAENCGGKRFNYAALMMRYNDCAVGDILLVSFSNGARIHNIYRTLERYGLVREIDVALADMAIDAEGNRIDTSTRKLIGIKRLSDTLMQPPE